MGCASLHPSYGLLAQFGGNDVTLVFGIKEDQVSQDGKLREEIGVIMTPVTAKMMALTLTRTNRHSTHPNHA
jgi:hypothetical protein